MSDRVSVLLEAKSISKRFGGLEALTEVSLAINRGEIYGLIGPNGAGKTTLINQLTGVLRPSSGSVWLDGVDITHLAPDQRVARGLSRTFQINSLFPQLTPLEAVTNVICERERSRLNLLQRRFFRLSQRRA